MEKKCFIILPTSDPDGYAQGHFNRVYEYIIAPACRMAGFWPERADNPNTNNVALDIMKNMVDSEMTLCDLSTNNSNALYGLAIRQALSLPLTLMKDSKTQTKYGLHEFGVIEYDESLRIDTVQKAIETLSEALKKNFADMPDTNSLLYSLGIGPGQVPEVVPMLVDTNTALNSFTATDEPIVQEQHAEHKETHLPIISPLPDYVGDTLTQADIDKLKVGESIFHMNHGKGEIKTVKKISKDKMAEILFESGAKILVLGTSGFFKKINV